MNSSRVTNPTGSAAAKVVRSQGRARTRSSRETGSIPDTAPPLHRPGETNLRLEGDAGIRADVGHQALAALELHVHPERGSGVDRFPHRTGNSVPAVPVHSRVAQLDGFRTDRQPGL